MSRESAIEGSKTGRSNLRDGHWTAIPIVDVRGKCRTFVAFLGIPLLPLVLLWLVLSPGLIPDGAGGSITRGLEICTNLGGVDFQGEKIDIEFQVENLRGVITSDLELKAFGPYGWLRVGPGTRGIWRDAGLTPDYVLGGLYARYATGRGLYLPPGDDSETEGDDFSWLSFRKKGDDCIGRSQLHMQKMQPEGMLQYMNTTFQDTTFQEMEVSFTSALRHEATRLSLFPGKYAICIVMCLCSALGAALAYAAQLLGHVQTPMDRLVFWYFTVAFFVNVPQCLGYLDSVCGHFKDYKPMWMFSMPFCILSNIMLQTIMLLKVQDLGTDSAQRQLVCRMAWTLKMEKLSLMCFCMVFFVFIFVLPPSSDEGWEWKWPTAISIALFFLVVFFLADLWFSLVAIQTYAAPLNMVRATLRKHDGADPETVQQLQKAFSVAIWNLFASVFAVISTSFAYCFVVLMWILFLLTYYDWTTQDFKTLVHDNTEALRHNGPLDMMRLLQFDSIVNDLCTIVFADLLFINFKGSMKERHIGWAIGQVGQHAAMLKQRDEEQQAELNRGLQALAAGPNPKLRHQMAALEKDLRRVIVVEYTTGDAGEAEQMLAKMQSLATEEMQRLTGLADTIIELYKCASARYEYIQGIQSFGLGLRQNVPERLVCGQNDNGPVMAFLYMQADLVVEEFNQSIAQLLLAFNEAEDPVDLGLDPQVFCFKIRTGGKGSQAVKLLGPKKTEARGWQKVQNPEDYGNLPFPQAAHLLDIVRAQVKFSEPYALAVFYHYLRSREDICEVVRVKNHFLDEDSAFGYLLVNVRLQDYVAELQLTLENLAELKSCMHAFYKVTRCARLSDLASQTIFHDLYSDKANVVLSPSATQLRQPQQIKATPPPAIIQHPSPPPKEQQVDLEQYILPNSIPRETES